MCFIDFDKAFDTAKLEYVMETLKKYMIDGRDIKVLTRLYWEQKAIVRVGENVSKWSNIDRGMRLGCVLSIDLFSL